MIIGRSTACSSKNQTHTQRTSRPKTPQEVAKAIKDSLVALDTKTVVEVKALEKVSISPFLFIYISRN
jgi:hypothetical protein